ncbi:MAG: VOC family protein [Cytophagales bacterium]|nr:MAG: VOC family protein [Cytophagales bacterium]
MNIKSVHHIAIICSNYNISKHFYTEILNLKIQRETFRADRNSYKLDLIVDNSCNIELFSFEHAPKRISNPEACGLRHLAFEVENIKKEIEYLNSKGIITEEIRIDTLTGKKFTFFQDPDGLPLELYEA